jgi:hypothetical protein
MAALGHAAWLVDAAHGHILAANAEAEELLGRGELEGLDAEDAIPDLEDMAYWDGVRCGVVSVLESDSELHLPDGRTCAVSRRIAPILQADGAAFFLVQVRDRSREQPSCAPRSRRRRTPFSSPTWAAACARSTAASPACGRCPTPCCTPPTRARCTTGCA